MSYNLRSIFVNFVFPECSILLHLASWVPLYAMGVEVSCKDSATLPNGSLPVQLSVAYMVYLPDVWLQLA